MWDTLEIDCSQIKVLVNNKEIKYPPVTPMPLMQKYKIRGIMEKIYLTFPFYDTVGKTWLSLNLEEQMEHKTTEIKK